MTVAQIITIAKISQYLSGNDIERSGLDGGGNDLNLPRKLYMIRKNVEWLYDLDPTNDTLTATSNYLYALCGKYGLIAQGIISAGGGVAPVVPAGDEVPTPITISGSDFANETDWEYAPYAGKNVVVFSNGIARYLIYPDEWIYISTGIRIVVPGFDSALMDYTMVITIIR